MWPSRRAALQVRRRSRGIFPRDNSRVHNDNITVAAAAAASNRIARPSRPDSAECYSKRCNFSPLRIVGRKFLLLLLLFIIYYLLLIFIIIIVNVN